MDGALGKRIHKRFILAHRMISLRLAPGSGKPSEYDARQCFRDDAFRTLVNKRRLPLDSHLLDSVRSSCIAASPKGKAAAKRTGAGSSGRTPHGQN